MQPKQKALTESDILLWVLRIPYSRLGHKQNCLNTVMLWLSDHETDNLQNLARPYHFGQQ